MIRPTGPSRLVLPLIALLAATAAVCGMQSSGATFTSTSAGAVAVTAAADWTPPAVAVNPVGVGVSGTTTVTVTAQDARSSVVSVTLQYSTADADSWTPICTTTSAPYSCTWATTSLPDGRYDLRALATDTVGNTAVSDTVTTRVVNNASVVLDPVPAVVRGNVTLKGSFLGGGQLKANIYFEYRPSDTTTWRSISGCGLVATAYDNPRTCTWATTTLADNDYDVRAVARISGALSYYDVAEAITVDNTAPATTLTVPAGPLTGTTRLTATALDDGSGMASVTFQYRPAGSGSWSTCGVDTDAPWRCTLDTSLLPDGAYEFRAIGTDVAGNTNTTPTQTQMVNNTISSVSITAPGEGDSVSGIVTVTAAANSTAGVRQVELQTRPVGGGWSPVCTAASKPYSCTWDTRGVTFADYELRAVLTDGTGALTASAIVPVTIDNLELRAQDVQVVNVSAPGLPAAGDRILLTYSRQVDLTSIKAGWAGASTPTTVTFRDKNLPGVPFAGNDWADLGNNLGLLSFSQSYVHNKKTVVFAATMSASTQSMGGVDVTVVEITLGAPTSGAKDLRTQNVVGTTRWYPGVVRSLTGLTGSTAPAVESGVPDRDF